MPFCNSCGLFDIYLKPMNLCFECFEKYKNNDLNSNDIIHKKKRISKVRVNTSLLYYKEDLFPSGDSASGYPNLMSRAWGEVIPRDRRQNRREIPQHNGNTNIDRGDDSFDNSFADEDYYSNGDDESETQFVSMTVPRNNIQRRPRVTFQSHLKSNIALILLILSIPSPLILSIPMVICAIVLCILGMREEERNWRHIFILVVGVFLLFLEILAIIYYDEILAMLEKIEQESAR